MGRMLNSGKRCVFILPYFGKFNNYFPLFLKSCGRNKAYDWMIFTDCKEKYKYPSNVHIIQMTLNELKKIAEKKLGISISMETPYKLCDYKPSYGIIFEEYIEKYEYWGHCDCDLIFGNLDLILTPLLEEGYYKIFAAGHLTLYKNTYDNNRRFMKKYQGEELYKKFFQTDEICVFDEDCVGGKNPEKKNVHAIFLMDKAKVYARDLSMNTSTTSGMLVNEYYDEKKREFVKEKYIPRRYYWNAGNLFSLEWDSANDKIISKEYLYIHLQMRKMRLKNAVEKYDKFQILPDRFIPVKEIPRNKKELKVRSIRRTYYFWFDFYEKKVRRKINKTLHSKKV